MARITQWPELPRPTLRTLIAKQFNSKLLQAEGRSSRSQGVVIFLSALAGNRSCEQGSGEGDERYRQAAWSIQEVRRTIFERCVAPSHISAFLQLLPPIFLCTHGSLEYNRLLHARSLEFLGVANVHVLKMFRVKKFSLPGWATKIF